MSISDSFGHYEAGLTSPLESGFDITPDNDQPLAAVTRAVMVRFGGDLDVQLKGGARIVLPAIAAGTIYPIRIKQVFATGTTAAGIVGLV